jgi:hypothetical protein
MARNPELPILEGTVEGVAQSKQVPRLRQGGVADFLNGGRHDRHRVLGMAKLEVHPATDVLQFKHRASPSGTSDSDLHGTGAKFGVAGEHSVVAAEKYGGIAVVESLDFEDSRGGKVVQEDAALNFRLNDCAVHIIGQVGVRGEHTTIS